MSAAASGGGGGSGSGSRGAQGAGGAHQQQQQYSGHAHPQPQQQQQQQQQQQVQQQQLNMEQMYMQQQRTTLTAGPDHSIVTRAHYAYLTPAEYQALNEHMRSIAIRTHTLAAFSAHTHQACGLIEGTASRLGFPRRTIATAQLLYTRFHLTYPPSDFLLHEVSLACLVLSSKICDTPKRTKDMIVTSYALRHPEKCKITTSVAVPAAQAKAAMAALSAGKDYIPPSSASGAAGPASRPRAPSAAAASSSTAEIPASRLMGNIAESDIDPARIENERGRILAIERLLLETTSFNFQIRAQNALALSFKLGRRLRAPRTLCDSAWRIAADAHRSPAPLIYPPLTIALASLYLASLFTFPPHKSVVDSPHTDEADRVADQQYYAYFENTRSPNPNSSKTLSPTASSRTSFQAPPRGILGASILGSSSRGRSGDTGGSKSQQSSPNTDQAGPGAGDTLPGPQRDAARLIMCFTASDGLFGDASTRPGGSNRRAWREQCAAQQQQQQQQQQAGGSGPARKKRKVEEGGSATGASAADAIAIDADEDEEMGGVHDQAEQGDSFGKGGDALADEALWLALGSSSGVAQVESAALIILDLYIESLRLLSSSPPFSGPLPVQPAHLAAGSTTSNTIVTSSKGKTSGSSAAGASDETPSPFSPLASPRVHSNGTGAGASGNAGADDKSGTTTTVVLVNTRQAPMPPSYALSPPPLEVLQVLNNGYGIARSETSRVPLMSASRGLGLGIGSASGGTAATASRFANGTASPSSGSQFQSGGAQHGPELSQARPPSPLELLQELDQLKLWLLRIGRRRERADGVLLSHPPPRTPSLHQTSNSAGSADADAEERRTAEEYARRRWETAQWRRWSAQVGQSTDDGRMRGIVPEDPVVRARFGLSGKGPLEYKQGVVRFLF
ncbi:RNA polymerase II C-terminal domain kinase beta subunit [Tilletia horrida]|nr:RNA polymerase II C-terminal domain kinase beta subunit [Tilletia horrida]